MKKHTGLFLIVFFLFLHLAVINDYGLTWDYHFHFFGGGKLLGYDWPTLEPKPLPYVEPDPRKAWTLPYGALMSIPPVASYLLLRNILPADSAYNLPIILWGVAGIGVIYFFLKDALNSRIALFAALFLALTPRYFGDMHNNMKDIPSAVIFALNMWLLWRGNLFLAVLAFAAAFNIKINSIFIPAIFALWKPHKKHLWYFLGAPVAAFLLWWVFWPNPVAQLEHAYRTFAIGTNNIEVLLHGKWYCSGSSVPWYYSFWYLAITTPLPILGFFFIGVFAKSPIKKLFLLWLFVPLTRYLLPSVGVIDGIRHFEEVVFPIAAIAALGADSVFLRIRPVFILVFALLCWNIISYHPYQITYFNEIVGGIRGAYGKYDLDYWGGSQKKAVMWVNQVAAPNAHVFIFMAPDVASLYLRPDLLLNVNKVNPEKADYTIILNRQSFFYRFGVFNFIREHVPLYAVTTHEVPLVWVFGKEKNAIPLSRWWQKEDPCIIKYW